MNSFVGRGFMSGPLPPALGLKRKRTEGRKREKFYICLDVTHTHIYIERERNRHIWFSGLNQLPRARVWLSQVQVKPEASSDSRYSWFKA
jgi:hypothetical protein